jgi:hypothetical protein
MSKDTQTEILSSLISRLSKLVPQNEKEVALVGYVAGAIYSLREVINHSEGSYSDEHELPGFQDILHHAIIDLANEKEVPHTWWLSGYYFNSALNRVSSLNDRIGKYVGGREDYTPSVRIEVNRLKHDVDGIIEGRNVDMGGIFTSINKLILALESIMSFADA